MNKSISAHVASVLNSISNGDFICTTAMYSDPTTEQQRPIISSTSLSVNDETNGLVIFGDNATGKSLVCNLIESNIRKDFEVRAMSVKNRTSKSIGRAFIFGDEGRQSTGETSVRVVKKAFGSAGAGDKPSLIILDEPDLGLSNKYASAMGRYIAQETKRLQDKGVYVVIVSHNTKLISAFCNEMSHAPSYIGLNTDNTLTDWLNSDDERSIEELLNLTTVARAKEVAIDRELGKIKRHGRL